MTVCHISAMQFLFRYIVQFCCMVSAQTDLWRSGIFRCSCFMFLTDCKYIHSWRFIKSQSPIWRSDHNALLHHKENRMGLMCVCACLILFLVLAWKCNSNQYISGLTNTVQEYDRSSIRSSGKSSLPLTVTVCCRAKPFFLTWQKRFLTDFYLM